MLNAGSPAASYACAVRLKEMVKLVQEDKLPKEDLIKNLEHAVSVLEAVFSTEAKRLANEEDDLTDVSSQMVPEEVRNWLTSTFTRHTSVQEDSEGKPTFKVVAHAIRAGIMVDKLFRNPNPVEDLDMSPELTRMLKTNFDQWNFDVFHFNELCENHALKVCGHHLLQRHCISVKFKILSKTLENFLIALEEGYSAYSNPYHNLIHAADVAQTCHCIIYQTKLVNLLSDLEIFAIIFSALIHDYKHSGTTNNFHVKTQSELAILYNDKGVLENFHVSAVFQLMKDEKMNILSGLSGEEYSEFRSMVISMVLSTDMSLHFQQLNTTKNLLSVPGNIDKPQALALILHSSDISHPSKPWAVHEQWTKRLLQEFFQQGDKEKELGLPCSPLCDRETTLVADSQIGFITFIVEPTWDTLTNLLQKITAPLYGDLKGEVDENGASSEEVAATKTNFATPWHDCAKENKEKWEARKIVDDRAREKTS